MHVSRGKWSLLFIHFTEYPHRPLGDYFRIKTRGGWSPKLLGRKFLLLHPIIFTVNQQLLLKHAVTASDLEWTPRKGERVNWRKALSCSVPGLLSGSLFKHSATCRRLWALPRDKDFKCWEAISEANLESLHIYKWKLASEEFLRHLIFCANQCSSIATGS